MPNAILETNYQFRGQTGFYRGKVRDVYEFEDRLLVIASDRISAFDHVLPRPIPHKGQVLNQIAAHFLEATKDLVPNWLEATPDPNVSAGLKCRPYKVEMGVRAYMAGHAWRQYRAGKRKLCGVSMPDGLREGDPFPVPIITPTTKAAEGHDEDISREEIIAGGLIPEGEYRVLESHALALFARGSEMAKERGLILVDTKYEFGKRDGEIYLIDELHTPDSSRYYYLDGYEFRQKKGQRQRQLSKEFVREWLMAHDFQGKEGQLMPEMPDGFIETVSDRYIELYKQITGKPFHPADTGNIEERIYRNVLDWLG